MATLSIISRARWGARYQRGFGPAPLPAQEVWLHHSVTGAPAADLALEAAAMRTLEDIGQQRFGGGISYTFAVMPSGRVYEGHGVDRQGAHTANRNSIARAIVLIGNYDTQPVTGQQITAVAALLQHGHAVGWWRAARLNGGHQQAPGAQTACPGRHAMAVIGQMNQLAAGPPVGDAPGEDEDEDMVRFLKGDSRTPIPGSGNTYGDVVFKVEYAHEFNSIAVRTRVPNPREPGFQAFLAAGGKIHQVPQAVLDAIPDKASARDLPDETVSEEGDEWANFWAPAEAG
ncbi:N-acetylmuramoyl-L-alanine amidase [Actinophytocola sediminis]